MCLGGCACVLGGWGFVLFVRVCVPCAWWDGIRVFCCGRVDGGVGVRVFWCFGGF